MIAWWGDEQRDSVIAIISKHRPIRGVEGGGASNTPVWSGTPGRGGGPGSNEEMEGNKGSGGGGTTQG